MHLNDVLCLFRDLIGKLVVIVCKKLHVFSGISVIRNEELVSSRVLAVVKITDGNKIDLILNFMVEVVLRLITLKLFKPLKECIFNRLKPPRIRVDIYIFKDRKNLLRALVRT